MRLRAPATFKRIRRTLEKQALGRKKERAVDHVTGNRRQLEPGHAGGVLRVMSQKPPQGGESWRVAHAKAGFGQATVRHFKGAS